MFEGFITFCAVICGVDTLFHCRGTFAACGRACWHCVCFIGRACGRLFLAYADSTVIRVDGGWVDMFGGFYPDPDSDEESKN